MDTRSSLLGACENALMSVYCSLPALTRGAELRYRATSKPRNCHYTVSEILRDTQSSLGKASERPTAAETVFDWLGIKGVEFRHHATLHATDPKSQPMNELEIHGLLW